MTIILGKCYGGNSCCSDANKCGEGEGDCDSDSNCLGDLFCLKGGAEGCHTHVGSNWDSADDCCVDPKKYGDVVKVAQKITHVSAQRFIFSF